MDTIKIFSGFFLNSKRLSRFLPSLKGLVSGHLIVITWGLANFSTTSGSGSRPLMRLFSGPDLPRDPRAGPITCQLLKSYLWPFYKEQSVLWSHRNPTSCPRKPGWCFQVQRVKGKCSPSVVIESPPTKPHGRKTMSPTQMGWDKDSTNRGWSPLEHTSCSIIETLSHVASRMLSPPSTRPW